MKRILCFGDSNTWGLIPGTDKRFADGVRWTSIIRNDLEQSGYEIIAVSYTHLTLPTIA